MEQHYSRDILKQQIIEAGLKATHQRIVVYEALHELHGHHPTAEEVFQRLRPVNPSISLGTVYKTLDSFAERELVKRVLSEEGGKRYDANNLAHNHIYCSNTKEIMDYQDEELEALLVSFFQKRNMENFEIKSISVQLTGTKKDPDKQISITRTE
ncbi:Fur family transcriptional regulator [Pontibacter sp. SGAir0037]|uniref:Fur family transcriptional regulator n=1 Tax=Pontibacter sp. SGAir0037 TaxID=2571030 RepID=UPI0010CCD4FC|nr:transcriptional repressor [Pontibacter sp. SGAir0037]QCR23310.1 transcriptional repressor [Pontibacter sp. SGAir0037]